MTTTGSRLPRHVAIIMDGNGRWARKRQLPQIEGHRAGVENLRVIIKYCAETGIDALTLFAFSSENWCRPPTEVKLLFDLFVVALEQEIEHLHEADVRLRIIGDVAPFPAKLGRCISEGQAKTRDNERLNLVIAANYGGRWDITEAVRKLAVKIGQGALEPSAISPELIAQNLALADLPEPDLLIRSGGEKRISNYLLWQLAYTELYFTDCLWPDFDTEEFEKALASYAGRQRRFGRTGEQVTGEVNTLITSDAE